MCLSYLLWGQVDSINFNDDRYDYFSIARLGKKNNDLLALKIVMFWTR